MFKTGECLVGSRWGRGSDQPHLPHGKQLTASGGSSTTLGDVSELFGNYRKTIRTIAEGAGERAAIIRGDPDGICRTLHARVYTSQRGGNPMGGQQVVGCRLGRVLPGPRLVTIPEGDDEDLKAKVCAGKTKTWCSLSFFTFLFLPLLSRLPPTIVMSQELATGRSLFFVLFFPTSPTIVMSQGLATGRSLFFFSFCPTSPCYVWRREF